MKIEPNAMESETFRGQDYCTFLDTEQGNWPEIKSNVGFDGAAL
jgi:hypothetical protein